MPKEKFKLPSGVSAHSYHGATLIARQIERYWKGRRAPWVRATVYEMLERNMFGVKSNLVGGLPPGVRG